MSAPAVEIRADKLIGKGSVSLLDKTSWNHLPAATDLTHLSPLKAGEGTRLTTRALEGFRLRAALLGQSLHARVYIPTTVLHGGMVSELE